MSKGVFSTKGFSEAQRKLAEHMGGDDGALAVKLRTKMVDSRRTNADGSVDLKIHVPPTLTDTDETGAAGWAHSFFNEAFRGKGEITVDPAPTNEGTLIGVGLKNEAASHYRAMMYNLDLAEQSLKKEAPAVSQR